MKMLPRVFLPWLVAALLALSPVGLGPANAVSAGGTVVAWGNNNAGETNVPADLNGVTAIAAGMYYSLALKSDGTVAAWGSGSNGQTAVPADLSGVTAIAAGSMHGLARKSDGTVVSWGWNASGSLNVPAGLAGVKAVAAGYEHSLALKDDGTVVAWGTNLYHQTDVPAGLAGVTAIAAGSYHSLALKSDGTVVAWGNNAFHQTDVPAGLAGVKAIAAGQSHSLALKNDGTVVGWGWNDYGQATAPAGLSGVKAIAAGFGHSLALKDDGTVVAWGMNDCNQATVPTGLGGVSAIAAGYDHNLALKGADVDSTPPTITLTTPAEGAVYLLNQKVTAAYGCSDPAGGSGLASCNGTVANGAPVDTSTVGDKVFTVSARDNAGNESSLTRAYSVRYAPAGSDCLGQPSRVVLPPLNADGTSVFKAGSAVPVKFRVADANGTSVGTPEVVTSFNLVSRSPDTVAVLVKRPVRSLTVDTGFRWDATSQQWVFNLDTKDLAAGFTYVYRIGLNDGTAIEFQFTLK